MLIQAGDLHMNIGSFSIVKNESDVIEPFIRHNIRLLDHMHIVDNASTDNTANIIQRLKQEGLPLTLEYNYATNHPQIDAVNLYLQGLKGIAPDFVFLLDADEFISTTSREALHASLGKLPCGACGFVPWSYYVPLPDDDQSEINPLKRIRHCHTPLDVIHKVFLPKVILDNRDFFVTQGNHKCVAADSPPFEHALLEGVSLAHFPVRSVEQLAKKIIIGEWALSTRNNRHPGEAFHWRQLHERIMNRQDLTPDDLEYIATNYSLDTPVTDYELVERPVLPEPDFSIEYYALINNDPLDNALKYAESYFSRLSKTALSNGAINIGKTEFGLIAYHTGDIVIGRAINLYGEWAAGEIRFLRQFIQPGDCIVDVGANIGTHTIPFSRFVGPAGVVIAFEPQRIPYQLLCANAVLNNLYNIHTLHIAVGSKPGAARIPVFLGGNIGNVGHKQWGQGELTSITPLDAFNFSAVTLIKIDVEGMENEVLDGAVRTINKFKPVIFVENNTEQNSANLIQKLFNLGYRCWWFFEPYYNPENLYKNRENIFADIDRPEINMICTHRDTNTPVNGCVEVLHTHDKWQDAWQRHPTQR